jgi:hypothetical protein
MTSTWTPIKAKHTNGIADNSKKKIENHLKTASHLETAAKYHIEAANFFEAGNYEKANQSINTAQAYLSLAYEAQREF